MLILSGLMKPWIHWSWPYDVRKKCSESLPQLWLRVQNHKYHNYLHEIDLDSIVGFQDNARPLKIVKNIYLLASTSCARHRWRKMKETKDKKQYCTKMQRFTNNFQTVCSHLYLVAQHKITSVSTLRGGERKSALVELLLWYCLPIFSFNCQL